MNNPVRLAKERLEKMEEVYTEEDIKKICGIIGGRTASAGRRRHRPAGCRSPAF
mgnify:CR=1 FL=1